MLVTRINHIAYPIANPESITIRESNVVSSLRIITVWLNGISTINRCIGNHRTIIITKPKYATNLSWKPRTHLTDVCKTSLLRRRWTFVEAFHTINLKGQWRRTIRHFPNTTTNGSAIKSKRCSLIMVAHTHFHIVNAQLPIWYYPQRHILCIGIFSQSPRKITVKTIIEMTEECPNTSIAESTTAKIWLSVCIFPREVCIFPRKPSHLTSIFNHILRIKDILLILHVEFANTTLIGMCTNGIIRNTHGNPYNTFASRSLSHHLHNPCFIRITNGKGFTLAIVAIGFCQCRHYTNGFLG